MDRDKAPDSFRSNKAAVKARRRALGLGLCLLFLFYAGVFTYFWGQERLDIFFLPVLGELEICSFLFVWIYFGLSARGKWSGLRDLSLMVLGVLLFFGALGFCLSAGNFIPHALRNDFYLAALALIFGSVLAWYYWYFTKWIGFQNFRPPSHPRKVPVLYLAVSTLILSLLLGCVLAFQSKGAGASVVLWVILPWSVLQPFLKAWLAPKDKE